MHGLARGVGALLSGVALTASLALAGCGVSRTLEEYLGGDEGAKAMETIRQKASAMTTYGDVSLEVEGNGIKCTVKLNKVFDENPFATGVIEPTDTAELAKSVAELEDGAHLSGCALEYVFRDANDLVLYQAKVNRDGLVSQA